MGGTVSQNRYTQLIYATSPETWTIDKFVLLLDTAAPAVFSNLAQSTLINNGFIHSITNGVLFDVGSTDGIIENNANATISGVGNGIRFNGDGLKITNSGAVKGDTNGMLFDLSADDQEVINAKGAQIFGGSIGILQFSNNDGGVTKNSGLIQGGSIGIEIFTSSGLTSVVQNAKSGVIQGGGDAILTIAGSLHLENHGKILGGINCGAGLASDVIVNSGKITGDVKLGSGNDTFKNTHGGSSGAILGGAGLDKITGGAGKNDMTGGADADTFFFKALNDSRPGGKHDIIQDFTPAQGDIIDLRGIDANSGAGGNQSFHFIGSKGFHHKAGELHFKNHGTSIYVEGDVNGDGRADFQIELKNVASIAAGDFHL